MKKRIIIFILSFSAQAAFSATLFNKNYTMANNNQINIKAKKVRYDASKELIQARGGIEIDTSSYHLSADEIIYDIDTDKVVAKGNVKATDKKGMTVYGNYIILKDKFKDGVIKGLIMHLPDNTKITAKVATKHGKNYGNLADATYTPCPTCKRGYPYWQIRAKKTDIDFEKEKVVYKNAFFEVYGIPVFYIPYFVHPTPGAKAQSGILVPQIHDNSLKIPIYYRAKSNIDLTITPRLMKNKIIFEGELRHKLESGQYNFQGSTLREPKTASQFGDKKKIKNIKKNRYHIFSKGSFQKDHYNYGFLIEDSSDKSYMKNYGYGNKPYLESQLYVNNVRKNSYLSLESLIFKGLRKKDKRSTDPSILPHMLFKKAIPYKGYNILSLLETELIKYSQPDGTNIDRLSLKAISTKRLSYERHILDISLYLKNDIYGTTYLQKKGNSHSDYAEVTREKNSKAMSKIFFIPEQHTLWKYSMLSLISENNYLEIEPQILLVIAGQDKKNKNKLINTDSQNLELKDDNLFKNNRYSGSDKHEYGSRVSYGITFSSKDINDNLNTTIFLGQLYRLKKAVEIGPTSGMRNQNSNIVGKITLNFSSIVEIYYKFSKYPRSFLSEKEDLGASIINNKITIDTSFSSIKNYNLIETHKYIRQASLNLGYNINEKWLINTGIRSDLSSNSLRKIIDYGIGVTYIGECVKINAKFVNNYTADKERGIKKTHSSTVAIGLKTLNY